MKAKQFTIFLSSLFLIIPFANRTDNHQIIHRKNSGNVIDVFETALDDYKEMLPATMAYYNQDVNFISPYVRMLNRRIRNPNLLTEHYKAYQNIAISAFEFSEPEVQQHFSALRNQNSSIDDFIKLVETSYSSQTISTLTREFGYETTIETVEYIEEINGFPFEEISDSFPRVPAQCIRLNGETVMMPGYRNVDAQSLSMFYTALIGCGMAEAAVVSLEGSAVIIPATIMTPIPPWIQAVIIAAALLVIATILIVYFEQISCIWSAICDFFLNLAPQGYVEEFTNVLDDITTTAQKSGSDGYVTENGERKYIKAITNTNVESMLDKLTNNLYFIAYTNNDNVVTYIEIPDDKYMLFVLPIPLTIMNARTWLDSTFLSGSPVRNVYSKNLETAINVININLSNCSATPPEIHYPDGKWGFSFYHVHMVSTLSNKRPHSFFGIPIFRENPNIQGTGQL